MLNPIRTIGSQFREYVRTHSSLSKKEAGALSQEMLERMGLSDPESILGAYPFQPAEVSASGWASLWP